MAENKSGIRSLYGAPWMYNLVQWIAGARVFRERMIRNYIKPFDGCKILDIGCGTGEYVYHIEKHCSNFEYYGFDADGNYIDYANKIFAGRKNLHFYHKILTEKEVDEFNNFDIVIATGVMHHLDDPVLISLLKLARLALKPGGRLITFDTCKHEKMNFFERFLVNNDRGLNIRFEPEYAAQVKQVFKHYESATPVLTYYNARSVVFVCWND